MKEEEYRKIRMPSTWNPIGIKMQELVGGIILVAPEEKHRKFLPGLSTRVIYSYYRNIRMFTRGLLLEITYDCSVAKESMGIL